MGVDKQRFFNYQYADSMKLKEKIKSKRFGIAFFFVLAFYFSGYFLAEKIDVEPLKEMGIAKQEEYVYSDSNGDDHEGQTLIEIKGLGEILTYKDVYLASIPMFLIVLIIKHILYEKEDDLKYLIFANCILGCLLVRVTSKGNIPSTVLFWLGIIAATYLRKTDKENIT